MAILSVTNTRGLRIDHTTIYQWVQCDAPELEKRYHPSLKSTSDSWRVDETYVNVKGIWMYVYCAVASQGNRLVFLLSLARDAQAAKDVFSRTLAAPHVTTPQVTIVDKNASYPKALHELKAAGVLAVVCELRQSKYLNNLIEQDHHAHQTIGQAWDGLLFV